MSPRGAPSYRALIHRLVLDSEGHPTADEVFIRAREVEPSISLATVYRNLRALVAEGRLRERRFSGVTRFDANRDPHAHLVCVRCGAIADFAPDFDRLLEPLRPGAPGWTPHELDLEVRGLCPTCAAAAAGGRPGGAEARSRTDA